MADFPRPIDSQTSGNPDPITGRVDPWVRLVTSRAAVNSSGLSAAGAPDQWQIGPAGIVGGSIAGWTWTLRVPEDRFWLVERWAIVAQFIAPAAGSGTFVRATLYPGLMPGRIATAQGGVSLTDDGTNTGELVDALDEQLVTSDPATTLNGTYLVRLGSTAGQWFRPREQFTFYVRPHQGVGTTGATPHVDSIAGRLHVLETDQPVPPVFNGR